MEIKKISVFILALIIVIIDQCSKWLIRQKIPLNKSIPIIDKFVYITHVTNVGAAFGMFPNGKLFFILISTISITAITILILKFSFNLIITISIGLILGGISGNLIDRIFLGSVTDFIDLKFFSVFNIADSSITIGTIIILLYYIATWKKPSK
jgi:signal peptidase II